MKMNKYQGLANSIKGKKYYTVLMNAIEFKRIVVDSKCDIVKGSENKIVFDDGADVTWNEIDIQYADEYFYGAGTLVFRHYLDNCTIYIRDDNTTLENYDTITVLCEGR